MFDLAGNQRRAEDEVARCRQHVIQAQPTEGGAADRQTQTDHDGEVTAIEEGANEATVNKEREERETPPGKSKDEGRPKRKIPARRYDETLRRNKKRRTRSGVYLESGKKRTHCKLIDAMVVGARTIERIVNDGYEWRDEGYKKKGRRETGERIHDPG